MNFFIQTFGCQQNVADSERIRTHLISLGMKETANIKKADYIVINTCMVRHAPENRVAGMTHNLAVLKKKKSTLTIVVTGCMAGMALRDKTGKFLALLKKRMPEVDKFLLIDEIGFDIKPTRTDTKTAYVPISNGCNNFCSYCVVPYSRGREISREFDDIINECKELKKNGYTSLMLLGQNVNSYGSDLIIANKPSALRFITQNSLKPVFVKHLGKMRIPTLFPYLLDTVAKMGFEKVEFMSSNPWDFSDELIDIIVRNKNISRTIHLPVQSGDTEVLKRMNRWYTREEYLELISKLKTRISNLKITTDIIVGFCGETEEEFQNTVDLVKKVGFEKAYIAMYSVRPMTYATKHMKDNVPYQTKKKRWEILENLIYRSKHK